MATSSIYKDEKTKEILLGLYDKKLESCNIDYDDIYVETEAGKTHIVAAGDKNNPPMVLLHGINAGAPLALEAIKNLTKHFRIYAVDTIGQTTKSAENRQSIKDNSYGIWLAETMDELSLDKAPVVGVSYGAFILQKLMMHRPEKIEKAIFVVPSGFVDGSFGRSMKELSWPLMRFLFTKKDKFLIQFLSAFYTEIDDHALAFQRATLLGTKMDYRRPPQLQKKDVPSFQAPVYGIFADDDIFFPGEKALARCKEVFPNFQDSIFLKNSKHIPDKSSFSIIEKQIKAWLEV